MILQDILPVILCLVISMGSCHVNKWLDCKKKKKIPEIFPAGIKIMKYALSISKINAIMTTFQTHIFTLPERKQSIFVSSLWHVHICFICGFLTESPVAFKLCEFSSVNNHQAFMNAVLFHRSIQLIYVPCTSVVWLIVTYWWCNPCATAFFSPAIFPNSPFPSPSARIFLCQVSILKH